MVPQAALGLRSRLCAMPCARSTEAIMLVVGFFVPTHVILDLVCHVPVPPAAATPPAAGSCQPDQLLRRDGQLPPSLRKLAWPMIVQHIPTTIGCGWSTAVLHPIVAMRLRGAQCANALRLAPDVATANR